ncbi:TetR/AcrR family transcriptional regulator [Paenibacillus sp. IB182493]|uniref:TetR/AcrR family transcriptional regulator n=2 Tax=Paenibacillus arenilitoris TaxID=2772299 RepID=A0A927H7T1_9BACL|nr:TetR/AcrR family transcriptional regulator [Paenibacillus arenilitoris]
MDRRKAKTRKALRKALVEVIEEKGIEHVSVSDLTQKADMNRGTFYLHYSNASEMLNEVRTEVWEGLVQKMAALDPHEYVFYAARNEPDPNMVRVIEYYAANADFFRVILGPKGDPAFAVRIKEFLKRNHIAKMVESQPNLAQTVIPKDFMIAYFAASNLSIIQHWLQSGMQQSACTIALMITHIVGSAAKHLFGLGPGMGGDCS